MRTIKAFFVFFFLVLIFFGFVLPLLVKTDQARPAVRIGYFPNMTHAPAMVLRKQGFFEKKLGPSQIVDWTVFPSGPSAIEAIFAGYLDIVYIGPSPAINGYCRSGHKALKVVSGCSANGAAMVIRSEANIKKATDLKGRKIGVPGFGNTQDVALRTWLRTQGLKLKEAGGDVLVLPLSNADIQTLFLKKEIDAAWTVEPWVSLLETKYGGKSWIDEAALWPRGIYPTAIVVMRTDFIRQHKDLADLFLSAHKSALTWMKDHDAEARSIARKALEELTLKAMPENVFNRAWSKLRFSDEILMSEILQIGEDAYKIGYLESQPELRQMFELRMKSDD